MIYVIYLWSLSGYNEGQDENSVGADTKYTKISGLDLAYRSCTKSIALEVRHISQGVVKVLQIHHVRLLGCNLLLQLFILRLEFS